MKTKMWILAGMMAGMTVTAWAQDAVIPPALWKTTVTAGGNMTRGNSETMLLNGSVISVFKQDKNEARVGIEANYGESRVTQGSGTNATTETDTNVNNARAFGEYRRLLTARNYVYGNAELLDDKIAGIDYRLMVGPGVGRYFLMSDTQKLNGEVGATYIKQRLSGADDQTVALRLAERYEVKVSATASLWESVEYLPSFDEFSRRLINSEVGAEAAMNARLSLRLVFQDKFNSDPAPGKDKNDITLIGALSYKL